MTDIRKKRKQEQPIIYQMLQRYHKAAKRCASSTGSVVTKIEAETDASSLVLQLCAASAIKGHSHMPAHGLQKGA